MPDNTESADRGSRTSLVLGVLGGLCLLTAGFAAATSWGALAGSHPLFSVLLALAWTLGLGLVVMAMVLARSERRWSRWWWAAAVPLLLLLGTIVYTRPFPATDRAVGIVELSSGDGLGQIGGGVRIESTPGQLLLTAAEQDGPAGTGLVFYPGARVDPRAYVTLLAPVAQAGHPVVIVKPPLGLAIANPGAWNAAVEAYGSWSVPASVPQQWALGGHSLGGVAASWSVPDADGDDSTVSGLVLWASYPASSLADSDIEVLSVSGTADGLTTPSDVDASADNLPADTEFVVIDGANHSQFGDYGPQGGDGTATLSDGDARTRIVEATIEFLDGLDGT